MRLYSGSKSGEMFGIIVENKHINGLETNLERIIITTLTYGFSVFNVCCGPGSIFASGINIDRRPH